MDTPPFMSTMSVMRHAAQGPSLLKAVIRRAATLSLMAGAIAMPAHADWNMSSVYMSHPAFSWSFSPTYHYGPATGAPAPQPTAPTPPAPPAVAPAPPPFDIRATAFQFDGHWGVLDRSDVAIAADAGFGPQGAGQLGEAVRNTLRQILATYASNGTPYMVAFAAAVRESIRRQVMFGRPLSPQEMSATLVQFSGALGAAPALRSATDHVRQVLFEDWMYQSALMTVLDSYYRSTGNVACHDGAMRYALAAAGQRR